MAEETKIGIKLEEETKPLKKLCEKLEESITAEFNKGVKQIDVMEMKEAIDMLKDLYEAKEKMVKACYYKQIVEAMEEHDFDDEEDIMDEGRKGYRGQPRDSMGRYMSRRNRRGRRMGYTEPPYYHMMPDYDMDSMEHMRDMDKMDGKMYYTEPMRMGDMKYDHTMPDSKYDKAKRGYSEKKEMGKDSPESMRGLEDMLNVVGEDIKELKPNMSAQEKALAKQKLSTWMQMLG